MASNHESYAEPVTEVLQKYSGRLIPLTRTECDRDAAPAVDAPNSRTLFPQARAPEAALSGLLLLAGCWDESHRVSQDVASPEGSYWHAIAHRIEPDAGNAAYWFRRVGQHAIFPELLRGAGEIVARTSVRGWPMENNWDPFAFIDWCERARRAPGSEIERIALDVQRLEWDLLFEWCAKSA
jgi:hypothetical protein